MTSFFKTAAPRPKLLALLCLAACLAPDFARAQADDIIPHAYPADRYEAIGKKSPFSLSSAADEVPKTFAENLALAGVIKIDGEYFAAIIDKTTQKRELISSKPNKDGIQLGNVESSNELDKVVVTLKKGGETSPLRYDMTFIKANTAKSGANPNQPPQGVPITQAGTNGPGNYLPSPPPPVTAPARRRFVPSTPPPVAIPIPVPATQKTQ